MSLYTSVKAQQETSYELSSIFIEGNNEFDDSDLKQIIQSKETPFWLLKFLNSVLSGLGSPPEYFDSTSITVDIVSLTSYYAVNGYFEASIDYNYNLDTISRKAELTYFVDEGDMFTYGNVNIFGLKKLTYLEPRLSEFTKFPSYEKFIQENLTDKIGNILSVLKTDGFMLASFDSTLITIDSVKNKTDMKIYFTPGKKFVYSEIRVEKIGEGANLVSDDLIRYVTNIHSGEIYNEFEIAKSRLRLARTGLFNSINLQGVLEDTVGNQLPLAIVGNIGVLNDLSPEVFIDNEFNTSNIGVGLSYTRKNFFGDARKLTISTKFKVNDIQNIKLFSSSARDSSLQTKIDISLLVEQPFLFSRTISASLEAYYKKYNILFTPVTNGGGKLRIAFDMPSYTFVNLLNPYLTFDILGYEINSSVNNIPFVRTPSSTTGIFGGDVGSISTNDFFYPSEGYSYNQLLEIALTRTEITDKGQYILDSLGVNEVVGDEVGVYYRIQSTIAKYLSLSRDDFTVAGFKLRIGYIQTIFGSDELIPPNQTFSAGGSNSVRGWKARELVPQNKVTFRGVTNPVEDNIRGGTFIIEGSVEYRRKFAPEYGAVAFIDFGNTWNGYNEFQFKQIAAAVGFGIRYYSPFAPFRIDFGWKLWDPVNEITLFDRQFFEALEIHFGIGEAF
jgi:outer membrane protein assembly factor BamA